jgi:hypothetical protein
MNPVPKRAVKVEPEPEKAPEPNPIVRFVETMTDAEAAVVDGMLALQKRQGEAPSRKPRKP